MSDELKTPYESGSTLYAAVRDEANDVLYIVGTVFEAWGTSGRTAVDYAIAQTDDAGDMYVGNFPTGTAAGHYYVASYLQAGGSPADTDIILPPGGELWWDGTEEQTETEYELIAYDVAKVTDILNVLNIYNESGQIADGGGVYPIVEETGKGVYP